MTFCIDCDGYDEIENEQDSTDSNEEFSADYDSEDSDSSEGRSVLSTLMLLTVTVGTNETNIQIHDLLYDGGI